MTASQMSDYFLSRFAPSITNHQSHYISSSLIISHPSIYSTSKNNYEEDEDEDYAAEAEDCMQSRRIIRLHDF